MWSVFNLGLDKNSYYFNETVFEIINHYHYILINLNVEVTLMKIFIKI